MPVCGLLTPAAGEPGRRLNQSHLAGGLSRAVNGYMCQTPRDTSLGSELPGLFLLLGNLAGCGPPPIQCVSPGRALQLCWVQLHPRHLQDERSVSGCGLHLQQCSSAAAKCKLEEPFKGRGLWTWNVEKKFLYFENIIHVCNANGNKNGVTFGVNFKRPCSRICFICWQDVMNFSYVNEK